MEDRDDVIVKDIGASRLLYRASGICKLLNIRHHVLCRIIDMYKIKCVRDFSKYKSIRQFHRRQVYEIAEIVRLEREGLLTEKAIKLQIEKLRAARMHYTFTEKSVKYVYGPNAGKPFAPPETLRDMGAIY